MSADRGAPARLVALLADDACGQPLGPRERLELARLRRAYPGVDPRSFERAAVALHLVLLGRPWEPLPRRLRRRILARAGAGLR